MNVTVAYRYDAVRYSPLRGSLYPFQILGTFGQSWTLIELSLEEAQDLHEALGTMLDSIREDKDA